MFERKLMFLLGLIAAVCYIPGIIGATIPMQWPLLSIALLPSLWATGPASPSLKLGVLFICYALVSTLWAPNPGTSVLGMWYILVWALAFWLGTTLRDLSRLWEGLAYGAVVSSLVAMFQALGWHGVLTMPDQVAGLYFNSTLLGAVCALTLVMCLCHRMWWPIPFLLGGALLSESRGAIFVLGVGIAARLHWLLALALALAGFAFISHSTSNSDLQRLEIWGVALHNLSMWGWGPDSFNDIFAMLPRRPWMTLSLYHLEFAHNDYLQLAFEFGIGATLLLVPFATSLTRTSRVDWPIFVAWSTLALFYFPLYAPLLAFIGCVCAGHLLRPDGTLRPQRLGWGHAFLLGDNTLESASDLHGGQALSMVPQHSHTEG